MVGGTSISASTAPHCGRAFGGIVAGFARAPYTLNASAVGPTGLALQTADGAVAKNLAAYDKISVTCIDQTG